MNYLLHNKAFILCFFVFLKVNALAFAQERTFVQLNGEPEFTIASIEEQHIPLSFLIKEGYHIQANRVKDINLIPSVLSIDAPDDLIIGDPIFPQAVEFRMKGVEEALLVYSDVLKIHVPVRTIKYVENGEFLIKGKLHYQACDAFKCYFPRDLDFILKIDIK